MEHLYDTMLVKQKKALLLALKIAIGSSISIYIAQLMKLDFASSAGIVTLLTLIATRKGTWKLSIARLITFVMVTGIMLLTFIPLKSEWLAYGAYIFLTVLLCELMDWRATISVNAVIGTHFLATRDFSLDSIVNEFWLVLIGIVVAFLLNLYHNTSGQREEMERQAIYVEKKMREIMDDIASYLLHPTQKGILWEEVGHLEAEIQHFIQEAYEYYENAYEGDVNYYVEYFEMRMTQFHIVHNLHAEMKKIRNMPIQAKVVSDYITYMSAYILELNVPTQQIEKLEAIFENMTKQELPKTREEFEGRAKLYHILMDLEEFLFAKQKFIQKYQTESSPHQGEVR